MMFFKWILLVGLLATAFTVEAKNGKGKGKGKGKCEYGSPLIDGATGENMFCGRGPSRKDCPPDTHYCKIEAGDRYAVCCPNEEQSGSNDAIEEPCPMYACADGCEFGYQTNDNGCTTCDCRPDCPIHVQCMQHCENGFVKDKDGCPTCTCRETHTCTTMMCIVPCEPGFHHIVDENGCQESCECEPDVTVCSLMMCIVPCKLGFHHIVDENGCQESCDCEPDVVCDAFACFAPCPEGSHFIVDRNGCQNTCDCEPDLDRPECPLVKCDQICTAGYIYDKNGCQTCECRMNPCAAILCLEGTVCTLERVQCAAAPCDPIAKCVKHEEPVCELAVMCLAPCPEGSHFIVDENGCQNTCDCEPDVVCASVACFAPCPEGSHFIVDENGCQNTCDCEPDVTVCSLMMCAEPCFTGYVTDKDGCQTSCECRLPCPDIRCEEACAHGSVWDENNCPTCECNEPCKDLDCSEDEVCRVEVIYCIRAPCPPAVARCVPKEESCTNGQVWNSCGSICDKTCDDPTPVCTEQCTARCECPRDAPIWHRGSCVPESQCSAVQCPMYKCKPCDYGYKKDKDGCNTCSCIKKNPCKGHKCDDGEKCELQTVQCFAAPCDPVPVCVADEGRQEAIGPITTDEDECPVKTCKKKCKKHGYKINKKGCQTCKCNKKGKKGN